MRVAGKFDYAIQLATRSQAGLQPARELDSVMEYDLNRSATRFEISRHVEIARTCLRQVGNQVCDQVIDLDSVLEFSLKQVADRLELSISTSSVRVGPRPGLSLDSAMEFGIKHNKLN